MLRTLTSRRMLPVALLASGALLLAGCGSDGDKESKADTTPSASTSPSAVADADGDGCSDFKSGDVSDSVTVAGAFGKTQTATFDKPLSTKDLERTVVIEGDGTKTAKGDEVDTLVTAYKGSDGTALGTQPLPMTVGDSSTIGAFAAGVDCVPLKSRVVVVVPAKDLYGDAGNEQAGIKGDDSIVIVTDVIGKKVPLTPAAWTKRTPTVTFDAGGIPTLKLPAGKPVAALELKVLKPGTGDVVAKGDQVTLDYLGMSWDTKKIFDKSYGRGAATFGTEQVVPGFGAALVGQKVGTRLVVTIPPKYAYGEKGAGSGNELEGQTLVFVIEIKSTAKA